MDGCRCFPVLMRRRNSSFTRALRLLYLLGFKAGEPATSKQMLPSSKFKFSIFYLLRSDGLNISRRGRDRS